MPCNCIWFDTETQGKKRANGKEYHYLWFGWAAYQCRWGQDRWTEPEWFRFTSREQFWEWVISKTRPKTRLYLFAHNGNFDLPVMGAFTALPDAGFKLSNAIVDAPPMVLTWKREKATIRFIDTLNIWRMPLAALGESLGLPKLEMPAKKASRKAWDAYGKQDTEIIRQACLAWFDFLKSNDLGGFAPTLASQAFNSYRHRFMPVPLFADNNQDALDLSRAAYLGGRTECFRIGRFTGEFYYIDINSMYPAVMKGGQYPSKLVGVYGAPSKRECSRWLRDFSVVADVTIKTDQPVYPVVWENRLVFPVGTFRCALASPELAYALDAGHVQKIHRGAVYEQAQLFSDFIDYFYGQRLEAKSAGNSVDSFLYKIMMNSLYGKFGQRGRRFETEGEAAPDNVAVWDEVDYDTQELVHMREFGGIRQRWLEEGESKDSFPAIAAHVTSYARQKLWHAINLAGRDNCYYCDTDSLVVNKAGYQALAAELDDSALGKWKLENVLKDITIHGAKDYVFDGQVKIKGIRKKARVINEYTFEQELFVGFKGLLREGSLDAPIIYPIQKSLTRNYSKGSVQENGDVLPLALSLAADGRGLARIN